MWTTLPRFEDTYSEKPGFFNDYDMILATSRTLFL